MRYRALRDCIDFSGRFHRAGDVVEFGAEEKVPRHLIPLDAPVPKDKGAPDVPKYGPSDEGDKVETVGAPDQFALRSMTKAELTNYAIMRCGVEIPSRMTKAEIIALIKTRSGRR